MEDMRRLMEDQMRETEEKMKTVTKLMVLKERGSWRSERQQLVEENRKLQRKLSLTENTKKTLESDLIKAKDTIRELGEVINSLNDEFSALKERFDTSRIILWKEMKKECQKVEEEIKKRDEMIVSLQQNLEAQKEETKRRGASGDETSWQERIRQLEALLVEKDLEISRVTKKRRARTYAHIKTLALLSETQSALEQSEETRDALENNLQRQLSQKEENWRKQLSETENFKKELSEKLQRSRNELLVLSGSWERRAQQWKKKERKLRWKGDKRTWIKEEVKKKEEIQRLTKENLQLQELIKEYEQKWNIWRS
ncbi:golgin subfamily A member 6-like protein 22 [Scomber scombrus]|uniref:Golgin subfamily A member 6-like protein 22 n=1 Tax=Scomber scombrus TaxID=13677 RepID=A0AAV1QEG9_SCOSC